MPNPVSRKCPGCHKQIEENDLIRDENGQEIHDHCVGKTIGTREGMLDEIHHIAGLRKKTKKRTPAHG